MKAVLILVMLMMPVSCAFGADDGLVLVKGGKFLMGSPESEGLTPVCRSAHTKEDIARWLKNAK